MKCTICGHETEDLEHSLLYCAGYNNIRMQCPILQQPYQENNLEILADLLLFKTQDPVETEVKKETIRKMWRERTKIIEQKN